MQERYTDEQRRQFEQLAQELTVEERRAVEQGWSALLAELRANHDLDPASPRARELAERWDRLTEATRRGFGDHQALWDAVGEHYRQGRFEGFAGAPQAEDFAFIERVKRAR
jgi:hypothetical protein